MQIDFPRIRNAVALPVLIVIGSAASTARTAAAPPVRQRAVDSVVLKQGTKLYGAVLSRSKEGTVKIAVQRSWLKRAAPNIYAEERKREQQQTAEAPRKRLQRIRDWIKERTDKKRLVPFLKSERKRLEKLTRSDESPNKKPVESQFMVLTIPADQIRGGYGQPANHRRIAVLAWRERLKEVESRTAKSLLKELLAAGKRPGVEKVDLSDRLPKASLETERQWAARKAVVEFDYLKRVRFQGTADTLVQAGGDAEKAPDVTAIFSSIYKSQLDGLLEEALGNGRISRKSRSTQAAEALQKAAKTADAEQVRGFRVTRVHPDLTKQRVTVEESFVAKMPAGKWATIWRHRETLDASKPRKELEARVRDDERVKQVLKLAAAFGLAANKDQIATAIRFGAAVQLAHEKAEDKFLEFRNTYSRSLDAKPIRW